MVEEITVNQRISCLLAFTFCLKKRHVNVRNENRQSEKVIWFLDCNCWLNLDNAIITTLVTVVKKSIWVLGESSSEADIQLSRLP